MAELAIPESPADLEGWTGPETFAFLVGPMARSFREARMTIGLLLHHLQKVTPEGEWGAASDRVSEVFDVSARTLRRWLAAYEEFAAAEPAPATKNRRLGQQNKRQLPKGAQDVAHTELTPTGQGILDPRTLESGETSKKREGNGGQQPDGSPESPRAHLGAAPAAEKAGEAKPAVPKPHGGSTPSDGGDHRPSAAPPPNGLVYPQPITKRDVVSLFARVSSLSAAVWRQSIDDKAGLLQAGRVFAEAARDPKPEAVAGTASDCAHQWKQQKGSSGNTLYVCSRCDERSFDKQKTA